MQFKIQVIYQSIGKMSCLNVFNLQFFCKTGEKTTRIINIDQQIRI